MILMGKKPQTFNVLELIWHKCGLAAQNSRRLRVTLQSEGEGKETLRLRDMATQSICAKQTADQNAALV